MVGVQQLNGGLSRTSLTCRVFSVSQHTGVCFTAGDFVPVPCKIFHRHSSSMQLTVIFGKQL